jgi:hypothetical protein
MDLDVMGAEISIYLVRIRNLSRRLNGSERLTCVIQSTIKAEMGLQL